ncbi:hypothetical protein H9P43_005517 [Blastocladiella emersonii ATCC 22665]|nr:hypothetical protein H9P43_005517 [Blastocladiella emersonii ATCC 22665]
MDQRDASAARARAAPSPPAAPLQRSSTPSAPDVTSGNRHHGSIHARSDSGVNVAAPIAHAAQTAVCTPLLHSAEPTPRPAPTAICVPLLNAAPSQSVFVPDRTPAPSPIAAATPASSQKGVHGGSSFVKTSSSSAGAAANPTAAANQPAAAAKPGTAAAAAAAAPTKTKVSSDASKDTKTKPVAAAAASTKSKVSKTDKNDASKNAKGKPAAAATASTKSKVDKPSKNDASKDAKDKKPAADADGKGDAKPAAPTRFAKIKWHPAFAPSGSESADGERLDDLVPRGTLLEKLDEYHLRGMLDVLDVFVAGPPTEEETKDDDDEDDDDDESDDEEEDDGYTKATAIKDPAADGDDGDDGDVSDADESDTESKSDDDGKDELEPLDRKDIARVGIVAECTLTLVPDGLEFLKDHSLKAKLILIDSAIDYSVKRKDGDEREEKDLVDGKKSAAGKSSATKSAPDGSADQKEAKTSPADVSNAAGLPSTRPRAKATTTPPPAAVAKAADATPASIIAQKSTADRTRERSKSAAAAAVPTSVSPTTASSTRPAPSAPLKERPSSLSSASKSKGDSRSSSAAASRKGKCSASADSGNHAADGAASKGADSDCDDHDEDDDEPKQWSLYSIEFEYLPGGPDPVLIFPSCPLGPVALSSVAAVLAVRGTTQLLLEFTLKPPSDDEKVDDGKESADDSKPKDDAEKKKEGKEGADKDGSDTFELDECVGSARFILNGRKSHLAAAEISLKIAQSESDDDKKGKDGKSKDGKKSSKSAGDKAEPESPSQQPSSSDAQSEPISPAATPEKKVKQAKVDAADDKKAKADAADEKKKEQKPDEKGEIHSVEATLSYEPEDGEDHHWTLSLKAKGSKAVARSLKRFGSVNLAMPLSSEVLRLTAASLQIDLVRESPEDKKKEKKGGDDQQLDEKAERKRGVRESKQVNAKTKVASDSAVASESAVASTSAAPEKDKSGKKPSPWKLRGSGSAEVEYHHTLKLQDGHPLMSLRGAANATIAVPLDGPTITEFNGMMELAWADAAAPPSLSTESLTKLSAKSLAKSSAESSAESSAKDKKADADKPDPRQLAVAARACWVPRRMFNVSFGVAGANLYKVSPEWLQFLLPKGKAQLVVRYLSWFKLADPKKPFLLKDAADPISTEGLLKLIASVDDEKKKDEKEDENEASDSEDGGETAASTAAVAPAAEGSGRPSQKPARRPRSVSVSAPSSSASASTESAVSPSTRSRSNAVHGEPLKASHTGTRPRAKAIDNTSSSSSSATTRPRSNAVARRPSAAAKSDAPAEAKDGDDNDEAVELPPRSSLLAITYAGTSDLKTKWDDKTSFSILVLRSPTSGNAFVAEISNVDLAALFKISGGVQLTLDNVRLTYRHFDEIKEGESDNEDEKKADNKDGKKKQGALGTKASSSAAATESKSSPAKGAAGKSTSSSTAPAAPASTSATSAASPDEPANAAIALPKKVPVDMYQAEGELTLLKDIKFSVAATMFRVKGSLDDWALRGQALVHRNKVVEFAPILEGLGVASNFRVLAVKQPMQKMYLKVLDGSDDEESEDEAGDGDDAKEKDDKSDAANDKKGKSEPKDATKGGKEKQKETDVDDAAKAVADALSKEPSLPPGLEKLFEPSAGEVLLQVALTESSGDLHPRLHGAAIALCVNIPLKTTAAAASTPSASASASASASPSSAVIAGSPKRGPARFGILVNNPGALFGSSALEEQQLALAGSVSTDGTVLLLGHARKPTPLTALMLIQVIDASFKPDASVDKLLSELLSVRIYTLGLAFERGNGGSSGRRDPNSAVTFVVGCTLSHLEVPFAVMCRLQNGKIGVRIACLPEAADDGSTGLTDLVNESLPEFVKDVLEMSPVQLDLLWLDLRYNWLENGGGSTTSTSTSTAAKAEKPSSSAAKIKPAATTAPSTAIDKQEKKSGKKEADEDADDEEESVTDIILNTIPNWSGKQDPPLVTAEDLAKAGKGKYTGKGFNLQSGLHLRLEGALWQPLNLDGASVKGVLQLGEVFAVHAPLPSFKVGESLKFDTNKLMLTRTDIDVSVATTIHANGKPWARFTGSLFATFGASPLAFSVDVRLEPAAAKAWIALGELIDFLRSIYLKGLRLGIDFGGQSKASVSFMGGLKIHDPAISFPVVGAVSLKLPPLKFFYLLARDVSFTGLLAPFVGANSAILRGFAWVEQLLPGIKHLEVFYKIDPTIHADPDALPDVSDGDAVAGRMRQLLIETHALEKGSVAIAARCDMSWFGMRAKIEGIAVATGIHLDGSASLLSPPTALIDLNASLSSVKWLGGRFILAGSRNDLATDMACVFKLDTVKGLLELDFQAYMHINLFAKLTVECRAQFKRNPKTGKPRFTLEATIALAGTRSAVCLSGFFLVGFQPLVPPSVQPMVEESFPATRLLMLPSEIGLNLRLFGATKNVDGTLSSAGVVECLFGVLGESLKGFVETSQATIRAAEASLKEKERDLGLLAFIVDLAGKAVSFGTSLLKKLTTGLIDVHSLHFGGGIKVDVTNGSAGAHAYLNVHAVILGTEFKFGLMLLIEGNFLRLIADVFVALLADVFVALLAVDYSGTTNASLSVGPYYPWVDGEVSTVPEAPKVHTEPGSRVPMLPNSATKEEMAIAAEIRKELQELTEAMASHPPTPSTSAPTTARCPTCAQDIPATSSAVDAHSAVCPKSLVRCVACDTMIARDAIYAHRTNGCKELAKLEERQRTPCPHCAAQVLDVNYHLKVECTRVETATEKCAKAGCGAILPVGSMDAHLKFVCDKNTVACTYCRAPVIARNRETHESYECPRRDIKCTRCAEMVPYVEGDTVEARLQRHARKACWTTCPRCTGIYLRTSEEAHRRDCRPSVPCNVPDCARQLFKTRILPNVYSGRCRFCDTSLPDDEALVAHLRTCAKALLAPATSNACGAISLHHGPDGLTPKVVLPAGNCASGDKPAALADRDRAVVTIAETVAVPCPRCCGDSVTSWSALGAHFDTCSRFERRCPTPGCGVLVTGGAKDAMLAHLLTACPNSTLTLPCPSPDCAAVVPAKDLNAHLLLECVTKVVRCPHCSEDVVGGLVRHLNQDCITFRVTCSIDGCPAPEYVKMDEFEHLATHHIILPPLMPPVNTDAIVGHELDLGNDPARALSSELARLGMDPSHPLYLEAVNRLVTGSLLVREPATVGLPCRNLCGHSFDAPHEEALHVAFKCSLSIIQCPLPNCDIAYAPGAHHIHAVTECIDARVPCAQSCPAAKADEVPLLMTTHHAVVECASAPAACWFCTERVPRADLARHIETACTQRHALGRCDQCATTFPRHQLAKHLLTGCSARRVLCGVGSCSKMVASADLVDHWLHECESSLRGTTASLPACTRCKAGSFASYRDWLVHLVSGDCKPPAKSHTCGTSTSTTMITFSLAGASDAVLVPCPMRCDTPAMPLGRLMEHFVVGSIKHPPCKKLDVDLPCPNSRAGCTVTVKRWAAQHHLQHECNFHQIRCPMCDEQINSLDLPNHCALECPKRYTLRVMSKGFNDREMKAGDASVALNGVKIVDLETQVDPTRWLCRGLHIVVIDNLGGGPNQPPTILHWMFDTHADVRAAWQIHHNDPTHKNLTSTVWTKPLVETLSGLVDATAPVYRVIAMAVYDEASRNLTDVERAAIHAMIGGPRNEIKKIGMRESYVAAMQLRPAGDGTLARAHLGEARGPVGSSVTMEGNVPWAM